jgi:hypothetical protein
MNAHAKLAKSTGMARPSSMGDILEVRADGADIVDGIEAGFTSRMAIC